MTCILASIVLTVKQRNCHVCHEIGEAPYYACLWGAPLRRYFELPAAGHMLAANLHADTYDQAREQVCGENGVPPAAFRRMNLLFFLAVERQRAGMVRRLASVWESAGTGDHRQVCDGGTGLPVSPGLVAAVRCQAATVVLDRLLRSGARCIENVRRLLIRSEARGAPVS